MNLDEEFQLLRVLLRETVHDGKMREELGESGVEELAAFREALQCQDEDLWDNLKKARFFVETLEKLCDALNGVYAERAVFQGERRAIR